MFVSVFCLSFVSTFLGNGLSVGGISCLSLSSLCGCLFSEWLSSLWQSLIRVRISRLLVELKTSRFLFPETLATNLFDSFAFKKLFNRLDNSMKALPTIIFCLHSDTEQLHFCGTPLPHSVSFKTV